MLVDIETKDVTFIVNDSGELGVKISNKTFWLYKDHTPKVYDTAKHENGDTIMYRPIMKGEFGNECRPVSFDVSILENDGRYTEGMGWKKLRRQKV